MPTLRELVHQQRGAEVLDLVADVLVMGGGPAASWAALAATEAGARVVVVDKGYLGTSGATAPSNTGTWFVPPGAGREAAIARRQLLNGGLAVPHWVDRVLDMAWQNLHRLADWGYSSNDDSGKPYLNNLRGPDYMAFMRSRVLRAGVAILDHHPALELLSDSGVIAGAAGIARQRNRPWRVRAGATVLATGGCAFGERMLGATGLTGDGYLMAAEAGATLSGMEFSAQYACAPQQSSLNKGIPFNWATFSREDGTRLDTAGKDRHVIVARALLEGPVWAQLDKGPPELSLWLEHRDSRTVSCPYDRIGVDPFTQRFAVTLRCEGTVRGVGGIKLTGDDCSTGVPGLYAAGDAASRERMTGAITGGGGPNSSWAIASGIWAGRAAANFAARETAKMQDRRVAGLGRAGLRPAVSAHSSSNANDILQMVREEFLPLDRNFFRSDATLKQSLARLDRTWTELRDHLPGEGLGAVRSREAAALTATSRWAYASALARAESRGMQRRLDAPAADPEFVCSFKASGIDRIDVRRSEILGAQAA